MSQSESNVSRSPETVNYLHLMSKSDVELCQIILCLQKFKPIGDLLADTKTFVQIIENDALPLLEYFEATQGNHGTTPTLLKVTNILNQIREAQVTIAHRYNSANVFLKNTDDPNYDKLLLRHSALPIAQIESIDRICEIVESKLRN
jgi:hypothetical protein